MKTSQTTQQKKERRKVRLTVWFFEDAKLALQRLGAANERDVAFYVRRAVDEFLERQKK